MADCASLHPPYDRVMPNYRRRYVAGGTYFFTVNLLDRSSDLLTRRIADLRAAYRAAHERAPFETLAIVVLPDHLHCLWRLPDEEHDFSTRWKILKAEFSKRLPLSEDSARAMRGGERAIWQRRFWEHAVRDETDFERHVSYIHFNPVKHGHVADPDDWPFSSWRRWKEEFGRAWSPDEGNFPTVIGER